MSPLILLLAALLVAASVSAKPALVGGGALMLPLAALIFRRAGGLSTLPLQAVFFSGITLGLIVVSALWSFDSLHTLAGAGKIALVFAGGLACLFLCRGLPVPEDRRLLLLLPGALALGFLFLNLAAFGDYALYRWWHGIPADKTPYIAVLNKSTAILVMTFGPVAALAWSLGTAGRGLVLLTTLLMGTLFMVSQSQSSQMGLLVFTSAFFALPVARPMTFRVLTFLLVWGLVLTPLIADAFFEILAQTLREGALAHAASAAQRLEVWDFIARRLYESPFVGYGYEGTRFITDFDSAQIFQPFTAIQHPHNSALQLWMEYGVLGATLGVYFMDKMLRTIAAVPDLKVRRLYLASFLMMVAISLVGWGMWQTWWVALVFVVTGLTILAGRVISSAGTDSAGQKNPHPPR